MPAAGLSPTSDGTLGEGGGGDGSVAMEWFFSELAEAAKLEFEENELMLGRLKEEWEVRHNRTAQKGGQPSPPPVTPTRVPMPMPTTKPALLHPGQRPRPPPCP